MSPVLIPERLETRFRQRSDRTMWLERLPGAISGLARSYLRKSNFRVCTPPG